MSRKRLWLADTYHIYTEDIDEKEGDAIRVPDFVRKENDMVKKIVVDLTDWSAPYPTGAIAFDERNNVVASEYCDDIEEFSQFFEYCGDELDEDARLIIEFDAENFCNSSFMHLVTLIRRHSQHYKKKGNKNER